MEILYVHNLPCWWKMLIKLLFSIQYSVLAPDFHTSQQSRLYGEIFRSIASLSQKTVSTLSLKNMKKTEKCIFQTHTLVVSSFRKLQEPFSKKLLMIKF